MKITPPDSPLPLEAINRTLRLVVLESPYDTIEHPLAQELIGKIARMKISGYKAEYPYGATPVDTGDFVGTHLLLCEQDKNGSLEPIMGFKSITHRRCELHGMEFPAYHLIEDGQFGEHKQLIRSLVEQAQSKNEEIAYNGSWTVRQDVRKDRALMQLCYDVTLLLLVRYYTDYRIGNVLAGATVRFKVHQFKEFMGFEYPTLHGKRLPNFPCKPFFNEEVALMLLRQFSPAAHRLADRYRTFWENRICISAQELVREEKKAA